jgi:hypothetical protein
MRRHLDVICWTLAAVAVSIHTVRHVQQQRALDRAVEAARKRVSCSFSSEIREIDGKRCYPAGDYPVRVKTPAPTADELLMLPGRHVRSDFPARDGLKL